MSEIAIVTGGNSGIGRACAVALARAGFDVGITWHAEEERARDAIAELEHVGVRAQARQVDLHDAAAGARVVDELAEALGGVDVLVNNAGYGEDGRFLELGLDDLRGVLEVDLVAPFACAQVAARRMVAAGRGGRIVNVTSVHEHVPMPESGPYVAAKHGLGGLTKVMALELAEHRILVNAVAPGQIATRMTGNEDEDPRDPAVAESAANVPLGRPGDAHEIAAVVAFLAGPGATYVTGASYVVDGGLVHIAAQHQG
jgi:NAD(P)-dependent dehydrogenase (short-subunit alcohol dehydrogenase family)